MPPVDDLTVSVAEILGRPGEYRELSIARPLAGTGTSLAHVGDAPVEAQLRIESVVEGVLVTGGVSAAATLECSRCLKEVISDLSLEVCELYTSEKKAEEDDDAYALTGSDMNLEPLLRDALTLALPLNPLCKPDCKGICPHCGTDLNQRSCECKEDETDPRWADLAKVRERLTG
jgi:uncharacterized protein